ncbi:GNAT family N-acetyltransferase [Arsenicitalea aurantiaca]|uniref:GNAT family N-acetyltransferase n=1 Tax=Arsenicitalea aurantiaca TaxID=1783274 RepID=A0A433XG25_9HYPH|nr:GNAT family N-acetyltransferase [Arsenicitalea aurantiaca]RUT33059.1 GNAT family N-acetyltransferase [Arsenicitalea aurantiaca]
MLIRPTTAADRPALWAMIEPIMREGETFALPRDGDEAVAMTYWSSPEKVNFIAEENGEILGSSYIRANQLGGGAHIANCGYMTTPSARGRGVARALCAHSIEHCRAAGFRGIQFNFVVSTNAPAVHLWESFGFETLARLPSAFAHPRLGFVDALVMFKPL